MHLRKHIVPVVQEGAIGPVEVPVCICAILLLACEAPQGRCSCEEVLLWSLLVEVKETCLQYMAFVTHMHTC